MNAFIRWAIFVCGNKFVRWAIFAYAAGIVAWCVSSASYAMPFLFRVAMWLAFWTLINTYITGELNREQ